MPRPVVERLHRRLADAAAGHVDDPLEGEVVGRLHDAAEIGERVADLLPLVESRAADDAIVEAERHEPVLERAHLERGAHQDRDLVQEMPLVLELLDLLADGAGLLLRVPRRGDRNADRVRVDGIGEQRLAEPPFVVGDEVRGGAEDVRRRAVVPFEADDLGARKILLEAEDVVDLRPAPAVDRLVVVADAADVALLLRQQPQPEVLRDVGVLVFVDEDVAEALVIIGEHVGVRPHDPQRLEQQVAEVGGVQRAQPLLIGGVKFLAAPVGELPPVGVGNVGGREAAVLPMVDQPGQLPRRPALLVDVLGDDDLLHQADLVVGVEDGEIGLEVGQLGVAAKHFRADRMKGAEPLHPLDHAADEVADAVLHLPRRLVGEGDAEDLPGLGLAGGEEMGDAGGQHARLAGPGAGEHQHRPFGRLDRRPLLRVQPRQIIIGPTPGSPRRNAAGLGRGRIYPSPFRGGGTARSRRRSVVGGARRLSHQARKSTNPEGRTL